MHTVWSMIASYLILHFCVQCRQITLEVRNRRNVANSYKENNMHGYIEKGYYVEVLIGTPPQPLNILIDTGSSNFAVASKENPLITKYFHAMNSTSRKDMGIHDIDIEYIEGFWKGHLITDLVTLPTANLTKQARVDIVEITNSRKFFINGSGWQGILGMAYTKLARPDDKRVKSFMQSIVEDTGIDDVFSVKLCMADVRSFHDSVSGVFILGGYNRTAGPIYWTGIVKEWFYDVQVLGMEVGGQIVSVECSEYNSDKTIVDSGTTNLRFPGKIFQSIIASMQKYIAPEIPDIQGFVDFWSGDDVLCWDVSVNPYALFPNLTLYLPSIEFNHTLTLAVYPEHYILFSGMSPSNASQSCYKLGISSSDTGTVLGAVLMEEYRVIFDRANKRIGFAISDCSPKSVVKYGQGYPNSTNCAYISSTSPSAMQITLYVLLAFLALCMLPVCFFAGVWCCKKKKDLNDTDHLLEKSGGSN